MNSTASVRFFPLLVASAALVLGCESSGPNLRSNYDQSADFSKYHTFNFVPNPATDRYGYSSLTTQDLKAAVTEQMQMRGYTLSDHPDLLVNFSGKLQDKQDIQSTPVPVAPPMGYYGYRAGFYGAWPGYASEINTVNYTEGTLNIDLIDSAKQQMVWEGVAVGEVTKEQLQNREATINKAVAGIFTRYPFRAGQGQPLASASN
jgi:hypothetical protein